MWEPTTARDRSRGETRRNERRKNQEKCLRASIVYDKQHGHGHRPILADWADEESGLIRIPIRISSNNMGPPQNSRLGYPIPSLLTILKVIRTVRHGDGHPIRGLGIPFLFLGNFQINATMSKSVVEYLGVCTFAIGCAIRIVKIRAGSDYAQVERRSVTFLDQTIVCREEKPLG